MEYKGYIASIEYDDHDHALHGHVVNSGPYSIVTFETSDPRHLRREFERSIDEYLQWCAEDGVEPERPRSWQVVAEAHDVAPPARKRKVV